MILSGSRASLAQYIIAAAIGSWAICLTFSPAISAASLVSCLARSVKYAGTVITASSTGSPSCSSANSFRYRMICTVASFDVN